MGHPIWQKNEITEGESRNKLNGKNIIHFMEPQCCGDVLLSWTYMGKKPNVLNWHFNIVKIMFGHVTWAASRQQHNLRGLCQEQIKGRGGCNLDFTPLSKIRPVFTCESRRIHSVRFDFSWAHSHLSLELMFGKHCGFPNLPGWAQINVFQ